MRAVILVVAALFCMPERAIAEGIILRGAGTRTCAEFARNYAANPKYFEDLYFTWAQGYMSAENQMFHEMGSEKYKDLGGDVDVQTLSIRLYCDRHPLALYKQAVDDLFLKLPLLDKRDQ